MSLRSMTGFGNGTARGGGMVVSVELSSVNRKSFDARISLPPALRSLQADVQRLLTLAIARGSVGCTVEIEWTKKARASAVAVDEVLAKAYVESIRKVAKKLGLSGDLPVETLLELPGVVEAVTPDVDLDTMRAILARAVKTALQRLDRMRKGEGATLQKDIRDRLGILESMTAKIRKRAPQAVAAHRRELQKRLAEAGVDNMDDDRFQRELVMYADRCDIAEELTRLESHFKQARDMIASGKPVGRGLDFLCQEMLREINTIASKSTDAEIAGVAIEFKSELERVREQVRNVE